MNQSKFTRGQQVRWLLPVEGFGHTVRAPVEVVHVHRDGTVTVCYHKKTGGMVSKRVHVSALCLEGER